MNEKQNKKGRQVPCEHFNILEIYGEKKSIFVYRWC